MPEKRARRIDCQAGLGDCHFAVSLCIYTLFESSDLLGLLLEKSPLILLMHPKDCVWLMGWFGLMMNYSLSFSSSITARHFLAIVSNADLTSSPVLAL